MSAGDLHISPRSKNISQCYRGHKVTDIISFMPDRELLDQTGRVQDKVKEKEKRENFTLFSWIPHGTCGLTLFTPLSLHSDCQMMEPIRTSELLLAFLLHQTFYVCKHLDLSSPLFFFHCLCVKAPRHKCMQRDVREYVCDRTFGYTVSLLKHVRCHLFSSWSWTSAWQLTQAEFKSLRWLNRLNTWAQLPGTIIDKHEVSP